MEKLVFPMKQQELKFTGAEYMQRNQITKREKFLQVIEVLIPWDDGIAFIALYYPYF